MRFDACAHSYEAHAAPQLAFAARVADFIQVRPGEQIVELGAGTGALTRHLCRRAAGQVLATDLSPAMVRQGQRVAPTAHWSVLDAFKIPVPTANLQVSSGLLQWADNPAQVLRSWKASLAPAGRMVHAFPCDPCLCEWRALVPETPLQWRDEAAWTELFAAAGLRVLRKTLWVEPTYASSALEVLRGFHRSGVTGQPRLGPGQLRQAIRRYDALHRRADGVVATWAWLAVEAT